MLTGTDVGKILDVDEADVPEMTGETMLGLIDEDGFPKNDAGLSPC